jgi:hypothetical protein
MYCIDNGIDESKVNIATIDNPGFSLSINLESIQIADQQFTQSIINRSEQDWVHCFVRDNAFECYCGPTNLSESLKLFQNLASNKKDLVLQDNESLQELTRWYARQCDGDWEHGFGIEIRFPKASTCHLIIELRGTKCENQQFNPVTKNRSGNNWLDCFVKDGKFNGLCYPLNLPEVLNIFRHWTEEFEEDLTRFFSSSALFKKTKQLKNKEEVLRKLDLIVDIIQSKIILHVIPFKNRLHFVIEDEISLDVYTKTVFSQDIFSVKEAKILSAEIRYPILNFQMQNNHFMFDLEYTFFGDPVSLEFRVPQQYAMGSSDWIPPNVVHKSWVLFV